MSSASIPAAAPPHGPAVARDLGSAADMSSLAIRGGPAVTRDLGNAADMFVGLRPVRRPHGPTAPRWRAT